MQRSEYWDGSPSRNYSRRRVLQATAAASAAMAISAACGGGGDDETSVADAPTAGAAKQDEVKSFLYQRADTSAQATKGGTHVTYYVGDVTLDPLSATSYSSNYQTAYLYPTLLRYKDGFKVASPGGVEANLAASWEQPDAQTIVFKLQPKGAWDPKLNGRAIDAEDVVFSWNKYAAKGQTRIDLANAASNLAPITGVTAIDKSTVQFKLAFPMAAVLGQLAYDRNLLVMPRESEGPSVTNGYNPVTETRSGGPWIMDSYQRSVGYTYKKNPNYWNADKVMLDGIDMPIITETAVADAQFRAKKIWGYTPPNKDVIGLRKEMPDAWVDQNSLAKNQWQLDFGMRPDSPFRDPRVRLAVSMLIDRDAYIDNWSNVSVLRAAGFPVEVKFNSHLSSGWAPSGYWVDPKSTEMGEGAKAFTLNVAEAKKLLSAAGFAGAIETEIAWIPEAYYGTDFPKWAETFKGFLEADGLFKLKQVNPPYATDYLPNYYWNKGDFKGIAVAATTDYPGDPDGHIFSYYHSKGSRQKVAFKGTETIDAKMDKMIEDQRRELDPQKRVQMIKDWQKYAATTMPTIPFPNTISGTTFTFYHPWNGNAGVHRAWDGESARFSQAEHLWFDKSKYTG